MICCFPFTYITDSRVKLLADSLGPVIVNLPAGSMINRQVKSWAVKGRFEFRIPSGLDESSLLGAVQEFEAWADMHGRKLSDISDFYRLSQGRPPLVDEDAPSQIRTQIKHLKAAEASDAPNQLYQSALFMALAHEYDLHQEAAAEQLSSVVAMEADLYATISGDAEVSDSNSSVRPFKTDAPAHYAPGTHMGVQRLQAWACLASQDAAPACAYITTSTDVFDHLLELLPENRQILCWQLGDSDQYVSIKQQRRSALDELGRAKEPLRLLPEALLEGSADTESAQLTLHLLPGVTPQALFDRISKQEKRALLHASIDSHWQNSIIGIITS
jgi:hypothetical protein